MLLQGKKSVQGAETYASIFKNKMLASDGSSKLFIIELNGSQSKDLLN